MSGPLVRLALEYPWAKVGGVKAVTLRLVAVALAESAGHDGTGARPGHRTLADRTGFHTTTVRRALEVLADLRLAVRKAGPHRGAPDEWALDVAALQAGARAVVAARRARKTAQVGARKTAQVAPENARTPARNRGAQGARNRGAQVRPTSIRPRADARPDARAHTAPPPPLDGAAVLEDDAGYRDGWADGTDPTADGLAIAAAIREELRARRGGGAPPPAAPPSDHRKAAARRSRAKSAARLEDPAAAAAGPGAGPPVVVELSDGEAAAVRARARLAKRARGRLRVQLAHEALAQ